MSEIGKALERCAAWQKGAVARGNPYRLACNLAGPLTREEIVAAWPARSLRPELFELWTTCREAELFFDIDREQWGLKIFSPVDSAARTKFEQGERPTDLDPADVVLGEFLGEEDMLVLGEGGEAFVVQPQEYRSDWRSGGETLGRFLTSYVEAEGARFWE